MTTFEATRRHVESAVEHLGFSLGAQISIALEGRVVLDLAVGQDGVGRPMRPSTLFAVYCSTKPLVGLATTVLSRYGALHLKDSIGDHVRGLRASIAGLTIEQLLAHTAGLHGINGVEINFVPEQHWLDYVNAHPPPEHFAVGQESAYSEFAAWYLLGEAITAAAGAEWPTFVASEVIEPLGLEDEVFLPMAEVDWAAHYERLGVNVDLRREDRPRPLLLERTQRVATHRNAAFGGYATARGLQSFYSRLMQAARGESFGRIDSDVVAEAVCPLRPPMADPDLGVTGRFGAGFMLDLAEFRFGGRCGRLAFGHSGNVGMSFAFADPQPQLAVGALFNGLVDPARALNWRRARLVEAIYEDLGL